jgi:5-methylcytosine-specific restriction endonuclease McrA
MIYDEIISREKQKARLLRKTAWWKNKCSRGICYYCEKSLPPNELTMDHIIPVSKGGQSLKNNIVTSCKECNNKKNHQMTYEWEDYMNSLKLDK